MGDVQQKKRLRQTAQDVERNEYAHAPGRNIYRADPTARQHRRYRWQSFLHMVRVSFGGKVRFGKESFQSPAQDTWGNVDALGCRPSSKP